MVPDATARKMPPPTGLPSEVSVRARIARRDLVEAKIDPAWPSARRRALVVDTLDSATLQILMVAAVVTLAVGWYCQFQGVKQVDQACASP